MSRIFSCLALLSLLALLANLFIGLFGGDYNGTFAQVFEATRELRGEYGELSRQHPQPLERIRELQAEMRTRAAPLEEVQRWTGLHVLLGIGSALLAILVNSISVTYFIGTARWCREVVETYRLPHELSLRCDAIKGKTFPYSLGSIVAVLVLAGLGAASYPGATINMASAGWVIWHHVAAWIVAVFLAWSYYQQAELIAENTALIELVTDRVQEIRRERGLEVEDDGAGQGSVAEKAAV